MKERVLILVRAIPKKSEKYGRLVCVAGINDDNEFRRLYPYTLRTARFHKKDIIEVEAGENPRDKRKESRRISGETRLAGHVDDSEAVRRLTPLITSIAKLEKEERTLGVIKPELLDARVTVNSTNVLDEQTYLDTASELGMAVKEKVKLPVSASYVFRCNDPGCSCSKKPHDIVVIDWEVNELARNVMKRTTDKREIGEKIRAKLFNFMKTRDFYLFVGTHNRWGTWLIIGFYYPQHREKADS